MRGKGASVEISVGGERQQHRKSLGKKTGRGKDKLYYFYCEEKETIEEIITEEKEADFFSLL